jgi:hypothetical protein
MNTSTCFPTSGHGKCDPNMRASFVILMCKSKEYSKLYFSQGLYIFSFQSVWLLNVVVVIAVVGKKSEVNVIMFCIVLKT